MTMQAARYTEVSWAFMAKAEEALAQGDLVRASWKGWRATAWALRGFARERGWTYTGFYGINGVMNRLVEEYDAEDIDRWFSAAAALEQNAYENWDSRMSVEHGLDRVGKLLRKLEGFSV